MELDPFFFLEGVLVLLLFFSSCFDSLATCSVWSAELVFVLFPPKKSIIIFLPKKKKLVEIITNTY